MKSYKKIKLFSAPSMFIFVSPFSGLSHLNSLNNRVMVIMERKLQINQGTVRRVIGEWWRVVMEGRLSFFASLL